MRVGEATGKSDFDLDWLPLDMILLTQFAQGFVKRLVFSGAFRLLEKGEEFPIHVIFLFELHLSHYFQILSRSYRNLPFNAGFKQ